MESYFWEVVQTLFIVGYQGSKWVIGDMRMPDSKVTPWKEDMSPYVIFSYEISVEVYFYHHLVVKSQAIYIWVQGSQTLKLSVPMRHFEDTVK